MHIDRMSERTVTVFKFIATRWRLTLDESFYVLPISAWNIEQEGIVRSFADTLLASRITLTVSDLPYWRLHLQNNIGSSKSLALSICPIKCSSAIKQNNLPFSLNFQTRKMQFACLIVGCPFQLAIAVTPDFQWAVFVWFCRHGNHSCHSQSGKYHAQGGS